MRKIERVKKYIGKENEIKRKDIEKMIMTVGERKER